MNTQVSATWQPTGPFSFRWPDGSIEHYEEGFQALCSVGGQQQSIVQGNTHREAAGKADRRRVIVFFGEVGKALYPVVEFVGANDFDSSGMLASVVKHPSRKHLRPWEAVPTSYETLPIVPYRDVVNGPFAARSLAVKAHKDELSLMALHAVLRGKQRGWL